MNKKLEFLRHIHVHPLFWTVAGIAIVTARFRELLLLFAIVLIHELGHAAAASFFSWRIKKIMLLPFGGVVEFEEHGNRPIKEEVIVVLAGPIQHLWLMAASYFLYESSIISFETYLSFIDYNVMILLFNCIPILPLDGGRLLYLLYANLWPFTVALKRAIISSFIFLFFYIAAIIIVSPLHLNGWLIAIFLLISLYNEWKNRTYAFMRFLIERYSGEKEKPVRKNILIAAGHETVQSVVERFQRGVLHNISIKRNGKNPILINESAILQAYFENNGLHTRINDLISH